MSFLSVEQLKKDWAENPRWKGIKRGYTAEDVVRLRGNVPVEYSLAQRGAEKLWELITTTPYVNCLGALTGGQAMQQAKAGVKAIYLSTRCRRWSSASTTLSNAPMKSSALGVSVRATRISWTISCPSSAMPKPGLAAC